MSQPIRRVTELDVDRVVRRDFRAEQNELVHTVLAEYGIEEWHREPLRVRMAALKLADGNLEALRKEINAAKCDYRDILAYAEYPASMKTTSIMSMPEGERKRIVDQDWRQYDEWLKK